MRKSKKSLAPLKLNLGCGQNHMEGYIGVDASPDCGADIVHDLTTYPWPFEDNSVEDVQSSHFLEHLTGKQRIPFFNELYRVLKVGGTATFITPHPWSDRAIQDPTHEWPPVSGAFYQYLNRKWREDNRLDHMAFTCDFAYPAIIGLNIMPPWSLRQEDARYFAAAHNINVAADIHATITKQ